MCWGIHLRRWVAFALALSLFLAPGSRLFAATVTGTIYAADGSLFTGTMLFRTLRTPLVSGSTLVTGGDYRVSVTNGALSTTLLAGDYRGFVGADQKGFILAVPSGSGSYSLLSLITNAITYTDQTYPWENAALATDTVSGVVKTDVAAGDPVVYLKSSVDALLATNSAANKLDITNGAAYGLSLFGDTIIDTGDELQDTVDYSLALTPNGNTPTENDASARPRTVATIASLVSDVDPLLVPAYARVSVLGYAAAGDGGGGDVRRVLYSSVSGTEGEDGMWFQSSNNPLYAWARVGFEPINARWFGAIADGSTDDTAPIQAWLNYVGAQNKRGYWPSGNYKITSTLIVTNSRVVIFGDSSRTITATSPYFTRVVLGNSANCDMLRVENGSRLDMRGVYFDGNRDNNASGRGIVLGTGTAAQFSTCFIEDVMVTRCSDDGFDIRFSDVFLTRCLSFLNDGDGYSFLNQSDVWVFQSYAQKNVGHGWRVDGTAYSRFILCDSSHNMGDGVLLDDAFANNFIRFQADRNGQNGLEIYADSYSIGNSFTDCRFVLSNYNDIGDSQTNSAASGTYDNVRFSGAGGANYEHSFVNCNFFVQGGESTATKKPGYLIRDDRSSWSSQKGFGLTFTSCKLNTDASYTVTAPYDTTLMLNANVFGTSIGLGYVTNSLPSLVLQAGTMGTVTITNLTAVGATVAKATSGSMLTLRRTDGGTSGYWDLDGGSFNQTTALNWIREQSGTGIFGRNGSADSADKAWRIGVSHYTNAEEPGALISGSVSSSSSVVDIGGGTSAMNAMVAGRLWAAANTTTTTGTQVGGWTTAGVTATALVVTNATTTGTIELGHASDTTLARSAAGVVTIEGVTVAERPATATLTYSGTNVTLTATSHVLHAHTLTLTNNCLLTISAADGASGGVTLKPDSSTSYTVYLASGIKLLGGGSSFVVTNSASETVNLEWKQTKRGASDVTLANKAVYP